MNPDRHDDASEETRARFERFERALADWARRPPRTQAPVAARRLLDRLQGQTPLPERRPWSGWSPQRTTRWSSHLALGFAMAAAVALGSLLAWHAENPSLPDRGVTDLAAAAPPATASGGDLIVLWLDAETPLYLNLPPAEKGSPL